MKKELIETRIVEEAKRKEKSVGFSDLVSKSNVNSPYGIGFIDGSVWMLQQFQWISVEDKFPTYEDGLVIIRCQNKNKEDGISLFDICYIDEETNTWGKRHHTWENITHWLPIPEFNQK